jgi:hypothetical protein
MRSSFFLKIDVMLFLLLLLVSSLVLVVPTVSASAGGSPSSITKNTTSDIAGYTVYDKSAGSGTIMIQSTWNVPTVTCSSSGESMNFEIEIDHIYAGDIESELYIYCSGLTAQYSLSCWVGGSSCSLPISDTVAPGDKIQTIGSVAISTGVASITIKDGTKWKFSQMRTEPINTKQSGGVDWWIYRSGVPIPQFSTIKTSGDMATLGGHHGTLGSFLSDHSVTVTEYIKVDSSNMHVLAKPTSITSTSASFSIKWIQAS